MKDVTLYLTRRRWLPEVYDLRSFIYEELGQKDKAQVDKERAHFLRNKNIEYAFKSKPQKMGNETVYAPF